MTRATIAEVLNRSEGSIAQRGRRLGVTFYDPSKNAIYSKNMGFFQTPTLLNSYIAGWIATDGWVRPESVGKPINQVGISLARKDIHILRYLKNVTDYSGVIREYEVDGHPQAELRISGVPQWIEDLERHWNITPNKTYTLEPPETGSISQAQLLAYHVGLVEGDGYIGISNNTLKISFVSASEPFVSWVSECWVNRHQYSRHTPAVARTAVHTL
ncbi:MAG: hypothetical protein OQK12_05775 [Motiliproteus sp.]|nr:hypothetical protein [Motiliproteus sp.]MCW9053504.1 hypothetical protein [Motiliproteus sp.]